MTQKYRLTWNYEAHPEGITKDQVPKNNGACDAMLVASILYPPDGSLSVMFAGHDGRTAGELEDREWFKVFVLLAARLGQSESLGEAERTFAQATFDVIRSAITSGRVSPGHH